MLRVIPRSEAPDALIKAAVTQRLPVFRTLLLLVALLYLLWWFVANHHAPHTYNPLWSRVLVSALGLLVWATSYFSDFVARNIDRLFYGCLYVLAAQNFHLQYMNPGHISWTVSIFIMAIATCATFQSRRALLYYSLFVFFLGAAISYGLGFPYDFFVPGLFTILLVLNLALSFQHRTVRKLSEVTDRLEKLFHATFEGICVHERGRVVDVNEAFCKMFNYTYEEMIGMDFGGARHA
jgi:PAS domain-containing protein